MFWVVIVIVGILALLLLSGFGKNRIFTHPEKYSDAELYRIMKLTGRILENTVPGTKPFNDAGAKHNAAYAEYQKRQERKFS